MIYIWVRKRQEEQETTRVDNSEFNVLKIKKIGKQLKRIRLKERGFFGGVYCSNLKGRDLL